MNRRYELAYEVIKAMDRADLPVLSVDEVVSLEKKLESEGVSLLELMTAAGKSVAHEAMRVLEGRRAGGADHQPEALRIVILAGSGNNGGDGWVAAAELAERGYAVTLVTKLPAEDLKAEPARTAAMQAVDQESFDISIDPSFETLERIINEADLIIDAILGTGFAHDHVRSPYDAWIRLANEVSEKNDTPILAVDCPSGLNAQTGRRSSACIQATTTVTMLAIKKGSITPQAQPFVGKLMLAPLVER